MLEVIVSCGECNSAVQFGRVIPLERNILDSHNESKSLLRKIINGAIRYIRKCAIGPTTHPEIEARIVTANNACNAGALDLALRARYHFANRSKAVDTSEMQFNEVKQIDPGFYAV